MNMSVTRPIERRFGAIIAPLFTLLLAWFCVVRILWNDWRIDPQYSYGILVPILVLGLCLRRSEDSPGPSLAGPSGSLICGILLVFSTVLLALVLPLAEANPDWRPLGLLAAMAAVTITLCLTYMSGGGNWLRHYAFPVCFFLIAVPWPRNLEQSVMNALTSWNAGTTLEILHWLGFEAARRGNLIMIPAGVLGIEEACSGIRSLQSGLMVALFFGEIFRLAALRRVMLLVTAVLAALLGNILRSSILAVAASREGLSAVATWHDPAGLMVLVLTFGSIFGVAYVWRRTAPPLSQHSRTSSNIPYNRLMLLPMMVLGIAMVGTECWFRFHESNVSAAWRWSLYPRHEIPGVTRVEVPQKTLKMLFYPEGFSEKWVAGHGEGGQVFYFRWAPGRTSQQAVSMHNPEVCLASIGMKMKASLPPYSFTSNGITVPFRSWLFEQNGNPVYVFHAMLQEGAVNDLGSTLVDDSPSARVRATLQGRRNRGQRMVEVAFWNLSNDSSARQALDRYLSQALIADPLGDPMKPFAR